MTLPMKASTAQNRRANDRLKRNSSGGSTFETNRLSFDAYPYLGASLGLTFFAASWVVLEFFFVEEELLSSRENELGVAVNALQNPVCKFHGFFLSGTNFYLRQSPVIVPHCTTTRTNAGYPPALNLTQYTPRCSISWHHHLTSMHLRSIPLSSLKCRLLCGQYTDTILRKIYPPYTRNW